MRVLLFSQNHFSSVIYSFPLLSRLSLSLLGSTPPRSLIENDHCHFLYLPEPISWTSKFPKSLFILFAPFKVLLASFNLLSILLFTIPTTPNYLFVQVSLEIPLLFKIISGLRFHVPRFFCFFFQNPPSIPTLPILQLVTLIKRSKLIIDWHNTGYSVLSLRLGSKDHFLVKIAKQSVLSLSLFSRITDSLKETIVCVVISHRIEFVFGKKAFLHLTVTENMKNQLIKNAKLE